MLASVAVVATVQAPKGHATDLTIRNGETINVTQTLAGSEDSLTVESGGSLATGSTAIVVNGADSTVDNRGSVSASDMSAYGLQSSAARTLFTNSGNLSTTGECAYGVYATGTHFTLINDGTISTSADNNSWGVHVNASDATIVNNRTIDTRGVDADGINVWGANANITNHGTLTTSGNSAIGVYVWHTTGVDSRNVLTNTGTIRATGDGAQGIWANARGMTVVNSGTIASRDAEAIYMGQADQTLTLLQGSVIEGVVRFDQTESATLNIARGLDASLTLNGVPGTIDTNGQPYVISDNVLTVVAAEPITAGATTTAATSAAVSNAVGRHVAGRRQGTTGSGFVPLAYAPTPATPFFPDFAPSYDHGAWTSAYGSFSVPLESEGLRVNQGGVLFGLDTRFDDGTVAGVFAGFGYGSAFQDNGATVDTATVLGGGYGTFDLGAGFVEATATFGATFNDSSRRIVNNSVTGGVERASGDYNGAFFSPAVTFGVDSELANMRITPSMTLSYAGIYQEGYTETGSNANLSIGSQYTNVVTARGEIELGSLRFDDAPDGWSGNVRLGAEGTWLDGDDVKGAVLGTALTIDGTSSLQGRGFVGADFGFKQGRYEFSAKTEVGYTSSGTLTVDVTSGIRVAF